MKTILIISAGTESVFGIKRAKELGYYVVVTDGNPKAPGFEYADDSIVVSTYDIERTLYEVEKYNYSKRKIDGVICIASDVPKTVAKVASRLGLISISEKVASLCSDKLEMKEFFKKNNIPVPWFKEIKTPEELKKEIENYNLEYVIKPVDSRGARGVLKISAGLPYKKVFEESISYSNSKKVILEKFIDGPQVSSESIIINKKIFSIAFADRNYEYLDRFSPNIIENGGQIPSSLDYEIINKISYLLEKVSNSLGIKDGILKGDIVVDKGEPMIIEVAPRLSGGYFSTHEIPLSTGIDLIGLAIKQSMGDLEKDISVLPIRNKAIAQRYWFPNEGIVKSISPNIEKFKSMKNVEYLEIRVKVGDEIGPINSHPARSGLVITSGNNISSAIKLAEMIVNKVVIDVV